VKSLAPTGQKSIARYAGLAIPGVSAQIASATAQRPLDGSTGAESEPAGAAAATPRSTCAPASARAKPSTIRQLPIAAQIYIAAVTLLGACLFSAALPLIEFNRPLLFVTLLVGSVVTAVFKVNLPLSNAGSLSVSYAVDFAALLLLGPHQTMLIAVFSAWSQCTFKMRRKNALYRTLFSMATLTITVQVSGEICRLLGGIPDYSTVSGLAKPLVGTATMYFLINSSLVASAISLSTRQPLLRVWNESFLWYAPSYFVGAGAAAVAAAVVDKSMFWVAPLTAAPLYLTYRTYKVYLGRIEDEQRHVKQVSDLHLATIEALALAIDAKDQTAHTHIRRVQAYAAGLAESFGMSASEIQAVKTAALLHDIGKLAVPEHILFKPGPLTPEEFEKIRVHPQVGAQIISAVPFPYPVAPLILSHHERWDGCGYPAGLRGDEIPLGARILTVVDCFDALTSDRPYHRAISSHDALEMLRHEAGKALDPTVVQRFLELHPTLSVEAEREEHRGRKLSLGPAASEPHAAPAAGFSTAPATSVLRDIALAHREIYSLYEIAQSLGTSLGIDDTMSLISSKLHNLMPVSCCSLFLVHDEDTTLRCRFASGVDAELLQQVMVHSGQGTVGWVARNRRPLVNARPGADFEAAGLSSVKTSLQSALVCPLIFNDRFIGTLAVYHLEPGCYREDHRRLLDRICEQAAAVIHNSIIFEQTHADSVTDPLTELPNTRFMALHLPAQLARAKRVGSEVSLLVADLDDFKTINDQYGHHVGDRALCAIARVLRGGVRPYDICIRYAGDEFVVGLLGGGSEEAQAKLAQLQQAVSDTIFEVRPGQRLRLSISVGAAVYPRDGETYEQLLAAADRRMYRDKGLRKQRLLGMSSPEALHGGPVPQVLSGWSPYLAQKTEPEETEEQAAANFS
jgi:diguanylate cyclase (GGDEF)-like protein/putative nucleotidyltransferase with HDIG domain